MMSQPVPASKENFPSFFFQNRKRKRRKKSLEKRPKTPLALLEIEKSVKIAKEHGRSERVFVSRRQGQRGFGALGATIGISRPPGAKATE
jgi:hypothetical protein